MDPDNDDPVEGPSDPMVAAPEEGGHTSEETCTASEKGNSSLSSADTTSEKDESSGEAPIPLPEMGTRKSHLSKPPPSTYSRMRAERMKEIRRAAVEASTTAEQGDSTKKTLPSTSTAAEKDGSSKVAPPVEAAALTQSSTSKVKFLKKGSTLTPPPKTPEKAGSSEGASTSKATSKKSSTSTPTAPGKVDPSKPSKVMSPKKSFIPTPIPPEKARSAERASTLKASSAKKVFTPTSTTPKKTDPLRGAPTSTAMSPTKIPVPTSTASKKTDTSRGVSTSTAKPPTKVPPPKPTTHKKVDPSKEAPSLKSTFPKKVSTLKTPEKEKSKVSKTTTSKELPTTIRSKKVSSTKAATSGEGGLTKGISQLKITTSGSGDSSSSASTARASGRGESSQGASIAVPQTAAGEIEPSDRAASSFSRKTSARRSGSEKRGGRRVWKKGESPRKSDSAAIPSEIEGMSTLSIVSDEDDSSKTSPAVTEASPMVTAVPPGLIDSSPEDSTEEPSGTRKSLKSKVGPSTSHRTTGMRRSRRQTAREESAPPIAPSLMMKLRPASAPASMDFTDGRIVRKPPSWVPELPPPKLSDFGLEPVVPSRAQTSGNDDVPQVSISTDESQASTSTDKSPAPTSSGELQSSTPTVEPQASTPTIEPQASTPIVEPQSSTPTIEPQASTPTVKPQSSTPTIEPQASTSTVELQSSTSTIEPQASTPDVKPQASTPTIEPQASTSTVEPQASTPSGDPQASTPTVKPQSSTPSGDPQASTPIVEPQSSTSTIEPQASTSSGEPQASTSSGKPQASTRTVELQAPAPIAEPQAPAPIAEPQAPAPPGRASQEPPLTTRQIMERAFNAMPYEDRRERLVHCVRNMYKKWVACTVHGPFITTAKSAQYANSVLIYGQSKYAEELYLEAVNYFTMCIAYAPDKSSIMMSALLQRARALYHLRKYDASLATINHALQTGNHTGEGTVQLQELKAKCEAAKINPPDSPPRSETKDGAKEKKAKKTKGAKASKAATKGAKASKAAKAGKGTKLTKDVRARGRGGRADDPLPWKEPHFQNPHVPKASPKVKYVHDPRLGRCLEATEEISPGEAIIYHENTMTVLDSTQKYLYCAFCLKRCYSMIPCPNCVETMYCSSTCLTKAYDSHHRLECKIVTARFTLSAVQAADDELMLVKALLVHTKQGSDLPRLMERIPQPKDIFAVSVPDAGDSPIDDYINTLHLRRRNDWISMLLVAPIAYKVVNWLRRAGFFQDLPIPLAPSEDPPQNTLSDAELFTVLLFLNHQATLPRQRFSADLFTEIPPLEGVERIGAVMSPLPNVVTHACLSNVLFIMNEDEMVAFAVRPVKKGEKLQMGYFAAIPHEPRRERWIELMERCGILCECYACINDIPVLRVCETFLPKFLPHLTEKTVRNAFTGVARPAVDRAYFMKLSYKDMIRMVNRIFDCMANNLEPTYYYEMHLMMQSVYMALCIMYDDNHIISDPESPKEFIRERIISVMSRVGIDVPSLPRMNV